MSTQTVPHRCEYGDPLQSHPADHYVEQVNRYGQVVERHYICDADYHAVNKILRRGGGHFHIVEPPRPLRGKRP